MWGKATHKKFLTLKTSQIMVYYIAIDSYYNDNYNMHATFYACSMLVNMLAKFLKLCCGVGPYAGIVFSIYIIGKLNYCSLSENLY